MMNSRIRNWLNSKVLISNDKPIKKFIRLKFDDIEFGQKKSGKIEIRSLKV